MKKIQSFFLLLAFPLGIWGQQLVINEISQGITGNREFVELVVLGPQVNSCSDVVNCVDIRGWIFDDNNADFSGGAATGTGIATGALRFAYDEFWSCIKPGTLILIYDVSETNTAIPPEDVSSTDGNCTLVIPVTSTLFDRHETLPSTSNPTYSASGWQAGGIWNLVTMQNGNDSFQVRDPANLGQVVHSVSWGNNTSANKIYFSGSASGLAFACVNGVSGDFFDQSNWSSIDAADQTPGIYNSPENAAFVGAMNFNCGITFDAKVSVTHNNCSGQCIGQAYITYEGGVEPYPLPEWSTGALVDTLKNLCSGNYSVTVKDAAGCSVDLDFTISDLGASDVIPVSANQTICLGESAQLEAIGLTTVKWMPGNLIGSPVTVTPLTTTVYTVSDTSAGTCYTSNTITISINTAPVINLVTSVSPSACGTADGNVTIGSSGSGTLSWTGPSSGSLTGITLPQQVNGLKAGTYLFTFSDNSGCASAELSVSLDDPGSPPKPTITVQGVLEFCIGGSVTLTSSALTGNVWSTGETTSAIVVTSAGTYTVENSVLGCSSVSDGVTVLVHPLPTVSAGSDRTLCLGQSTVLIGSGAATYSWDNGVNNGQTFSPSTTQTYTVTGTSSFGCISTDEVTITVAPYPSVDAGDDLAICPGENVTLQASGSSATYTWNNAVLDGVPFSPNSTNTYEVEADFNGCKATDQITVTVHAPLPLDAGGNQNICLGETLTLSATGGTGYDWNLGVVNGVAFSPTLTQTYEVTSIDAFGCVYKDQVTITVNDPPTVDAGPDQVICLGSNVTLTATGAESYVWDNGVQNGIAFAPTATQIYTVVGSDDFGCTGTATVKVTVEQQPVVSAGADLTICKGEAVTLAGTGATNYTWTNGVVDGVSFVPTASGVYQVTGSNAGGCSDTDEMEITWIDIQMQPMSDQRICAGDTVDLQTSNAGNYVWSPQVNLIMINDSSVRVYPNQTQLYQVVGQRSTCSDTVRVTITVDPIPTIVAGEDMLVCRGDSVLLQATGATVYVWNETYPNGVYYTPTQSVDLIVIGSTNNCAAKDTLKISVAENPQVIFDQTKQQGCVPFTVQFTQNALNGLDYLWDFGDTQGSEEENPTHTYTSSGYMHVSLTVTSPEGCKSSVTADSMIHLIDRPIASFAVNVDLLSVQQDEVIFTNFSKFASTYSWDFGDGTGSPDNEPFHTYDVGDQESYRVRLIAYAAYDCPDTTWMILPVDNPLLVYVPNAFTPDGDRHNQVFLPIIYSGVNLDTYELLIFDRWGELIYQTNDKDQSWDGTYKDQGLVQTGIYTWKITFETKKGAEKMYTGFVSLLK